MSEPSEESGTVETSLEEALAQNFAALSGESAEAPPPEEAGTDTTPVEVAESDQESEVSPTGDSIDALEPLEKWTDETKAVFSTLPIEAQQAWLDREKDVERYITERTQPISEAQKRYERLDEVFKPYEEAAKQRGVDLTPHVANAMQYYFAYQQNPLETVRALIQTAGLEQDQVFEDESLVDPSIRALRQELRETKQQLQQIQSQPPPDQSEAQKTLREFTEAKDEQGNPKYPHFEQLRGLMAPLVNDGKSLEEAYEEAQWSLPDYRKAQLERERKQALKEAEGKRAEKVSKAKRAAETLPSSDVDVGSGLPKFNGKWEDALKQTMGKLQE